MEKEMFIAMKKAVMDGNLYDFIADNYYQLSKEDLKEIILNLVFDGEDISLPIAKKVERVCLQDLVEREDVEGIPSDTLIITTSDYIDCSLKR